MDKSRIGAEWDEPGLEPSLPIPIWDGGVSRLVSAAPGKKKIWLKISLFQKHVFIFNMRFGMSFHFQNVVLYRKVFSFSKWEKVS